MTLQRTSGPAVQHADIPLSQSTTLGLHPVARMLLLISRPAEDRRLSKPEHPVSLLKVANDTGEIRSAT